MKNHYEQDIQDASDVYLTWFKKKYPQAKEAVFTISYDQVTEYFGTYEKFIDFSEKQTWKVEEPINLFGYAVRIPIV
jgi:hypothetical protein